MFEGVKVAVIKTDRGEMDQATGKIRVEKTV